LAPEPYRVNLAPDEFVDEFAPELNFNSYQVSQDVSQQYKESLQLKTKRVSFVNKLKNFFS
jgi:cell shape-determining protein MreC